MKNIAKRVALGIAVLALGTCTAKAQEVVGRLPRGWQPQTSYPMAYDGSSTLEQWRNEARDKIFELMGLAPEAPSSHAYTTLHTEQREGYKAHKIRFEISANNHIVAYLLVPDSEGPHPALVALHDHGAKFSIGKEKVIRPIDESPEVVAEAEEWLAKCYDGVYTGDWFAQQGYVVLAIDALLWGNRGEGDQGRQTKYDTQQALASNCLKLGTTLCGIITWDDLRSIDFVASLPFVDSQRIGVYGHSMGGHRAWMAAALSDKVAASATICWMATAHSLLTIGNNELKGGSAFTMQIPMISRYLDNPDIASLACPRPVLMIAGEQDKLFPIGGVQEAFEKMQRRWAECGAEDMFESKIYTSPHYFGKQMQSHVADFFARHLRGE